MNPDTGIADRSQRAGLLQQPEACGRCHARRATVVADYEYGHRLLETHSVSLLEEDLYHADGRILGEVYVYGSFVQSKMYAAGVTCSDCHDPHTARLRTGPEPNDACAQCHLPTKFATAEHSDDAAKSGDCVGCHMRDRTYMGIDARRDHSFRLPDTATDANHYGAAIAAARADQLDLDSAFDAAYPAIARATLLSELPEFADATATSRIVEAFDDTDPLVRAAVLRGLMNVPPTMRPIEGAGLLNDPIRTVRIEAARAYNEFADLLSATDRRALVAAAEEYRESLALRANFPEALLALAEFELRAGNDARGGELHERALRLDPALGIARHAYGLWLVRAGEPERALEELRLAAELEPDNPRFVYVYAVALYSGGDLDGAMTVVRDAAQRFPDDPDIGAFSDLLEN